METGPVLIAVQLLLSFLSPLVLERRTMFAALIAGEKIVLPEETSRIKPQPRLLAGFWFGENFFASFFLYMIR